MNARAMFALGGKHVHIGDMRLSAVYGLVAVAVGTMALLGEGYRLLSQGSYDLYVFALGLGLVLFGVICFLMPPRKKASPSKVSTTAIWLLQKVMVVVYFGIGMLLLADALWGLHFPRAAAATLGFASIYVAYRRSEASKDFGQ